MPQAALFVAARGLYPARGRIAARAGWMRMTGVGPFGQLEDGTPVQAWRLGDAAGLSAEILEFGGILAKLEFPGAHGRANLVLGLGDAGAYERDPAYLGILVGRFGNRIAGAAYRLDGREHRVTANEGRNHLHGGARGFGGRLWQVDAHGTDALALRYRSPDGEEGYPGDLDVCATYRLRGARLRLEFEATCDAPTPFNPTHHPYFNLAGDPSVPAAAQWLQVPVAGYLPVDAALIPLGQVEPAAGSPFDFRQGRTLEAAFDPADPQLRLSGGYDHCLVLDAERRCTAMLYSPHSGIAMRIDSDAPALQLYGGQALDSQHPGLGRGLCLEPQGFPDAPNQPAFPDTILRPGSVFRRFIEYRFATPGCDCSADEVVAALERA
jgi:aldose 1-epimerase